MPYHLNDIYSFLEKRTGCSAEELNPETDIFSELGVVGDDFHEMMEAYHKEFNVNLSAYRWYFHADEEGGSLTIGALLFEPPYRRVKRIPVTPDLLLNCANLGTWSITYPDHQLPRRRYDILVNTLLMLALAGYFLFRLVRWIL